MAGRKGNPYLQVLRGILLATGEDFGITKDLEFSITSASLYICFLPCLIPFSLPSMVQKFPGLIFSAPVPSSSTWKTCLISCGVTEWHSGELDSHIFFSIRLNPMILVLIITKTFSGPSFLDEPWFAHEFRALKLLVELWNCWSVCFPTRFVSYLWVGFTFFLLAGVTAVPKYFNGKIEWMVSSLRPLQPSIMN